MKAVITQHLVRKTRFGHSITTWWIEAKKEEIVEKVNSYIYERANRHNFIPVEMFEVKIYNSKKQVVNSWEYKPTLRVE